eukprot:1871606-Pyramimonas_sp.AAC.1
MVSVLRDMKLYRDAAVGCVNTGLRAALGDSTQDQFICREAAAFWKERDMRRKVTAAAAEVREE